MDFSHLNLFLKMLEADYALNRMQLATISRRMLADSTEFERIWYLYKNKSKNMLSGDSFRPVLQELLD